MAFRRVVVSGAAWLLTLLAVFGSAVAFADDETASELEAAFEEVERALRNETGLSDETKAALQGLVEALRNERTTQPPAPVSTPAPQPAAPGVTTTTEVEEVPLSERPLLDRMTFYGDLRLRYESQFGLDTSSNRHRGRVRFRPGVDIAIHDQVTVGARLTTGDPEDITSANQTLDDVFDKFEISLDRIYLTYKPEFLPNSYAKAGKFGAPWRRPTFFDGMTWDGDAQPEGVALGYTWETDGFINEIEITGMQLFVEETSGTEDAWGTVVQIAGDADLSEHFNLEAGVTYFQWSDLRIDSSLAFLLPDNNGNVTIDRNGDGLPDDFDSDFGIVHPFMVLTYDGWKYPVQFTGEYVHNVLANNDRDTGWSLGIGIGEAKKRGEWQAFYQWVVLEQDSVLTAVNSDDFSLHSGFRGHHFGFAYQLTDRIQIKPNAYAYYREHPNELIGEDDGYQWKTRLDLIVKF